ANRPGNASSRPRRSGDSASSPPAACLDKAAAHPAPSSAAAATTVRARRSIEAVPAPASPRLPARRTPRPPTLPSNLLSTLAAKSFSCPWPCSQALLLAMKLAWLTSYRKANHQHLYRLEIHISNRVSTDYKL